MTDYKSSPGTTGDPLPASVIVVNEGEDWANVELNKGRWAKIDRADIDLIAGKRWKFSGGYSYRKQGAVSIPMHREILGLPPGDPRLTDHANHDGTDNRRANIRPCTPSQNMANSVSRKQGMSSQFRGVSWNPSRKAWQFGITVNGKRSPFVYFDTEEEAALAYNRAALEAWGEFAVLNDLTVTAPKRIGGEPAA
jgi:hypothetical protein